MLLGIERKADHTLLKLGTTTFKNYYRGTPFIKLIITSLTVRELIRHPLTPIYTIGKVYSPKAYLFGLSMKGFHPTYDKETPEQYKKIFAEFAEMHISSKAGKAKYNPETFVIEQQLPSKRKYPGRPKLLKRYTFQETSANTYAINNLEYNLEGEVVLSSAAKAMFAFQTEPEANIHGPAEFNIDLASIII